ncbi:MAG TPA: pentapeptide repeat-containing protein [Ktedonobacterales bacterium]|nr:pentapeptide repeat-containing protein [Ktedonobacterales bacterium]
MSEQGVAGTVTSGDTNDSAPSPERQAELRAACAANLATGAPPYVGVRIRTRGEVAWIMDEHGWSGQEDEYTVKYTLIPQGKMAERANLRGAWMAEVDLTGMLLRRADLRGANLVRARLAQVDLVDADLSGADLGYADLSGANLTWVNLSGAHLRAVNLSKAWLIFATLNGATFARCDLRGAILRHARMDAATLLGNVTFDAHTQLRDIAWNGASLTQIDWSQTPRLGDEDDAHYVSAEHGGRPTHLPSRWEGAARTYQQLAVALRDQGISVPAARFAYRSQALQRRVLRQQRHYLRASGSWLLDLISGYGYKPMRSLITYLLVIGLFAIGYYLLGGNVTPALSPLDALIFSVTSFHGRGFAAGEAVSLHNPLTILAAGEAVLGLLIEIVFIATFTQRFFSR